MIAGRLTFAVDTVSLAMLRVYTAGESKDCGPGSMVVIFTSGNGPCAVSSLDWEGQFFPRQHAPLRQER